MAFLNQFKPALLLFGAAYFSASLDGSRSTVICSTESHHAITVLPDHILANQQKALDFIFYCLPELSDQEKADMKKIVTKADHITTRSFNFKGFRLPQGTVHFPEGIRMVMSESASVETTDFHTITVAIKSPHDVSITDSSGLVSRDGENAIDSDLDVVMIVPDHLYRKTWEYGNIWNLFQ